MQFSQLLHIKLNQKKGSFIVGDFWSWFVGLFKFVLIFFYNQTHSLGWSIILLTLLLKLVLFPTSIKQFQAMHKMKVLQPKLKEIQDKYKDKPEEFQRRTMELYQKEKVNPFGSCLPMLIQIPLFIAIYNLINIPKYLAEPAYLATALHHELFLGVLPLTSHNLILAIISGATTYLQQKITMPMTGGDQSQQQAFLYIMPIFFGYITFTVNAGVGLYWVASNIFSVIQQYLINEYFIVKEHIQTNETEEKAVESKKK